MLELTKKKPIIRFKELLLNIIFPLFKTKIFQLIFLNKKPKILINQNFREKQNERLVLFSTFNSNGKITKNLKFYLKSLFELGSDIVLVDTSPISINEEIKTIQPYIKQYIWRENIGYDFGSWKTGLLETNHWKEYKQIVITNDSIYGPVHSLKPIFEKFNNTDYDVWGLIDSYEFEHHIMSYFLVFQNQVLKSNHFKNFWVNLKFYPTRLKKFLILAYEIGGSKYWVQNGFKVGSLIEYKSINQNINSSYYINPTHVFWDIIVKNYGFPFIKRDLVKALMNEGSTNELKNLLETNQYYPLENIDLIS